MSAVPEYSYENDLSILRAWFSEGVLDRMLEYPPRFRNEIELLSEAPREESTRMELWRMKAVRAGRRVLTELS